MSLDNAWNAYVFRDGKNVYRGADLVRQLGTGLAAHPGSRSDLIELVLRAGELECALADSDSAQASVAESLTQAIADSLVTGAPLGTGKLLADLQALIPPQQVRLSPPEGFAYYALHPLDIADLARSTRGPSQYAAVIGIRSIGTTLSAVVQSALRTDGVTAERITVRPIGHPYNRKTEFSAEQVRWVHEMCARTADFIVVDEGPGMSGSSFLSVGEALVAAGVPRAAIRLLGSRAANPDSLTSHNAGERWRSFRFDSVGLSHYLPSGVNEYLGGGIWRGRAFADEACWPASWIQMERMKFVSEDGSRFYKYEGLGRFGKAVHDRAAMVATANFGPAAVGREEGFGIYPFVSGRYLSCGDTTETVLRRLADYCAFRAQNITSDVHTNSDLETMLSFNTGEEFGIELPSSLRLELERPVIADGRMLPHKWIDDGERLQKVDATVHGDDHFFPGPTDIAWDLAGTIVEWNLHSTAAAFFLNRYHAASGDDASERLPAYLLAYSIFRTAYCKMASAAMRGTFEQERLERAYRHYRQHAAGQLEEIGTFRRELVG